MRHARVYLKKGEKLGWEGAGENKEKVLLDLGILATAEKWNGNCVKVSDGDVCQNDFLLPSQGYYDLQAIIVLGCKNKASEVGGNIPMLASIRT